MKQHLLAEEDRGRGERGGKAAREEKPKDGKQIVYLNVIASGESFNNDEVRQLCSFQFSIISIIFCFGQL